jgi:hypothetical protein
MGVDSVPLIHLLLSRLASDAVPLLNLPHQLIVFSVDNVDLTFSLLFFMVFAIKPAS